MEHSRLSESSQPSTIFRIKVPSTIFRIKVPDISLSFSLVRCCLNRSVINPQYKRRFHALCYRIWSVDTVVFSLVTQQDSLGNLYVEYIDSREQHRQQVVQTCTCPSLPILVVPRGNEVLQRNSGCVHGQTANCTAHMKFTLCKNIIIDRPLALSRSWTASYNPNGVPIPPRFTFFPRRSSLHQ